MIKIGYRVKECRENPVMQRGAMKISKKMLTELC